MIDIYDWGWLFETGILKPVHIIYRGLKSDFISNIVVVNVNNFSFFTLTARILVLKYEFKTKNNIIRKVIFE